MPLTDCFDSYDAIALAQRGPFSGEGWAGMAIDGFPTRSVRDQALLLDVVSGPDMDSPYHAPPMRDTFQAASLSSPDRLRIGLADTSFSGQPIDQLVKDALLAVASNLEDLGHHIEPLQPEVNMDAMMHAWTDIVACGTALWIDRAVARAGRPIRPDDIEPVARSARAYAKGLSGSDYLSAVQQIHSFGRDMAALFRSNKNPQAIDVILSATLAEPPAKLGRLDHSREDYLDYRLGPDGVFSFSPFTAIFNASGQPAASSPLGWTPDGLPVGIHLACAFGEDELLMSLCAEIEKAYPWFDRRSRMARG